MKAKVILFKDTVLVPSQEPWGYPFLLVKFVVEDQDK